MNNCSAKKNTLIVFFVLAILFSGCKNSNNFKIEGHFKVADKTPVKLFLLQERTSKLIDSVDLIEGNSFVLKGMASLPSIYLVKFLNNQSIYLIVSPGDKFKIDIDNSTQNISYYVEGSYDSRLVKEIADKQHLVLLQIDQLSQEIENHRDDSIYRKQADIIYANLLKKHKEYTTDFIYKHPKSMANILALYQNFGRKSQPLYNKYEDLKIFNFVDSNLVELFPGSAPVIALDREVAEIKDQIAQNKYLENTVTEGNLIPKSSGISIAGDTISIDPDEGVPCLIYFWATWNSYSIEELLLLDSLKKLYKPEELKIITFSLDISKEKLQTCIDADSIKVPVLCDYKYWDSEMVSVYSIKRIPADILTNREGIVIAKDLYSDELFQKVSQVVKGRIF
jgi:thiol-disulfide isomerase/thioredoxin